MFVGVSDTLETSLTRLLYCVRVH